MCSAEKYFTNTLCLEVKNSIGKPGLKNHLSVGKKRREAIRKVGVNLLLKITNVSRHDNLRWYKKNNGYWFRRRLDSSQESIPSELSGTLTRGFTSNLRIYSTLGPYLVPTRLLTPKDASKLWPLQSGTGFTVQCSVRKHYKNFFSKNDLLRSPGVENASTQ